MIETALFELCADHHCAAAAATTQGSQEAGDEDRAGAAGPALHEFREGRLNCYHPTGRYETATIVQRPWQRQKEYDAKGSALISIEYLGVSNANYTIVVGVLGKPQQIKTVIRSDTAAVHAYENCELGEWVDVK